MKVIETQGLLDMAEVLGITICPGNLHSIDKRTDAFAWPEKHLIVIEQTLLNNRRRMRSILAEEIGHCLHPPREVHVLYHYRYLELTYAQRTNIQQVVAEDERNAIAWATRFLMPDNEFRRLVREGSTVAQIAEYFEVEPWFVHARLMTSSPRAQYRQGRK